MFWIELWAKFQVIAGAVGTILLCVILIGYAVSQWLSRYK